MSDNNVIEMPRKSKEHLDGMLVGPFEQWHVVISGRRIPRLTGFKREDGKIILYVDNRFGGGPFEPEEAYQAAYLIAQATAVAEGYSSLEAEEKGRCFAPRMMNLGGTDGDEPLSE